MRLMMHSVDELLNRFSNPRGRKAIQAGAVYHWSQALKWTLREIMSPFLSRVTVAGDDGSAFRSST